MLQWLCQAIQETPKSYGDFFIFCTLTGLRASECIACIELIKDPDSFKTYYNENRQCLEHFRFPNLFIRRTKAAYISFVDKDILEIAQNCSKIPTYYGLKKALRHSSRWICNSNTVGRYSQRTLDSQALNQFVDLLQGRVPKTVFARHYFTPSLNYRDRVIRELEKLKNQIEV